MEKFYEFLTQNNLHILKNLKITVKSINSSLHSESKIYKFLKIKKISMVK